MKIAGLLSSLVSLLLLGVWGQPFNAAQYRVTLTIFNFYNDDVRLTIDGNQIYLGHMRAEPSTGLNISRPIVLHRCSDIELVSERANFKRRVCLKDSTRGIFVSPDKPYVEVSDSDGPALD